MRKLLATAVAIAPMLVATGAQAEIVISNARTTPIQTSNATGTGPDNIRLASGGSEALGPSTPEQADAIARRERTQWVGFVRGLNIQAN